MWVFEWIFIGVTALQVLIWIIFPMQLVFKNKASNVFGEYPDVSVVICARNEAKNLQNNLPLVLGQDYPGNWEIVVVDDASVDNSRHLLDQMVLSNARLRVVTIKRKEKAGKKEALTAGIEAARNNWLVLTDADCQPASTHWLRCMMNNGNQPDINLILGYAPMLPAGKVFNIWARFETLYTALQYLSTARLGWPFMGVGRNIAYKKSLFVETGGFTNHAHIAGGDDDLLVNEAGARAKSAICTVPDSFVYSSAKNTITSWMQQKKRHLNAGKHYKTWHSLVLGGVAFSHSAHYGIGIILLISNRIYWPLIIAGYLIRLIVIWPIMWRASWRFREKRMATYIPVLDGLMAVWVGVVAPVLLLLNPQKTSWK